MQLGRLERTCGNRIGRRVAGGHVCRITDRFVWLTAEYRRAAEYRVGREHPDDRCHQHAVA